jgi:hypothetical protein
MMSGESFRGGARIGWEFWGWPFCEIVVTDEYVQIAMPRSTCKLDRADICLVSDYKYLFSKGVQIEHRRSDLPDPIAFFWFKKKRVNNLKVLFDLKGYPVSWGDAPISAQGVLP